MLTNYLSVKHRRPGLGRIAQLGATLPIIAALMMGPAATAGDTTSVTEQARKTIQADWPTFVDQIRPRIPPPNYVPKRPGHYSAADWQAAIDSTWGPGLPLAEKQAIYDTFWSTLDARFACFHDLDTNVWDSIWQTDSAAIADSVSRGRFAAILGHAAMALRDYHTGAADTGVILTQPLPGVPLLYVGGWGLSDHFGAGLTPLPDSSLLVYDVLPSHPLGLAPGDQILGYDGGSWKDLYKELLDARLPLVDGYGGGSWWGSSEPSFTHSWLISAGLNWHLFDTIDVVKYTTGDTLHLATSAMVGHDLTFFATEQVNVPGVTKPDPLLNQYISWGILDDTRFGYIYCTSWNLSLISSQWRQAIERLTVDSQVTGLIVDFRTNEGGWPPYGHAGFGLLFANTLDELRQGERDNPMDHYSMMQPNGWPTDFFTVYTDSMIFYDRPIAVLTGPGAISAGDINALQLSYHPMARVFGKPTCGAFSKTLPVTLAAGFQSNITDFQLYRDTIPQHWLAHDEFPSAESFPWVDYEDVWLTPNGVAEGRDDVVEAAIAWMLSRDYDQDGVVNENDACPALYVPGNDPVFTGDVNIDGALTSGDIIWLVNYSFKSGLPPMPIPEAGDVNCDGVVSASDVIYVVNHVFKGGDPPCDVCAWIPGT